MDLSASVRGGRSGSNDIMPRKPAKASDATTSGLNAEGEAEEDVRDDRTSAPEKHEEEDDCDPYA
jgi:hypothetical protein